MFELPLEASNVSVFTLTSKVFNVISFEFDCNYDGEVNNVILILI